MFIGTDDHNHYHKHRQIHIKHVCKYFSVLIRENLPITTKLLPSSPQSEQMRCGRDLHRLIQKKTSRIKRVLISVWLVCYGMVVTKFTTKVEINESCCTEVTFTFVQRVPI